MDVDKVAGVERVKIIVLTGEVIVDFHVLANEVNALNKIYCNKHLFAFFNVGHSSSYSDHYLTPSVNLRYIIGNS